MLLILLSKFYRNLEIFTVELINEVSFETILNLTRKEKTKHDKVLYLIIRGPQNER
jgi:hypothetical protein